MRCHFLRMLKSTAVREIGGDAGRAEGVVADRRCDAGGDSTAAQHAPRVSLGQRLIGELGCLVAWRCAEQPAPAVVSDPGSLDIGMQRLGGIRRLNPMVEGPG